MDKWKYMESKIRNEEIRLKRGVVLIDEKLRESHLRWFGYVHRREINVPVRTSELIYIEGARKGRGKKKIILI